MLHLQPQAVCNARSVSKSKNRSYISPLMTMSRSAYVASTCFYPRRVPPVVSPTSRNLSKCLKSTLEELSNGMSRI